MRVWDVMMRQVSMLHHRALLTRRWLDELVQGLNILPRRLCLRLFTLDAIRYWAVLVWAVLVWAVLVREMLVATTCRDQLCSRSCSLLIRSWLCSKLWQGLSFHPRLLHHRTLIIHGKVDRARLDGRRRCHRVATVVVHIGCHLAVMRDKTTCTNGAVFNNLARRRGGLQGGVVMRAVLVAIAGQSRGCLTSTSSGVLL